MDTFETLRALCSAHGSAGGEDNAAQTVLSMLKPLCYSAEILPTGSVVGYLEAPDSAKKTVMLEAHLDEIGMVVTYINDDGSLKVGLCGGIDRRLLPAQTVTIHGKRELKGVISTLPPHVEHDDKKAVKADDISVDTGMSKENAQKLISLGDTITLDSAFSALKNGIATGKAIDDRCGVAAILYALEQLRGKKLPVNVAACFCLNEEIGGSGAVTTAYSVNPDFALAIDVSFALTPGCEKHKCGKLGGGAMIGVAPPLDRTLTARLREIAERHGLPYQLEVMNGDTGTDADEIYVSRGGVRTVLLSVPEKYMHMPVECVKLADVENVGALTALFVTEGVI